MIIYFADRQFNILGKASTELPKGLTVVSDNKTEEIENGVKTFECFIPFKHSTRLEAERFAEVGNYLLRSADGENEFYTIIEAEVDTKKQEIYIYAEDAGMDLINEVVGEFEASESHPITYYIEKYASGSSWEIGINEAEGLTRKLSWDNESTAAERIASIASQFGGCEISFTFAIEGLNVTHKYINIYKKRGKDLGVQLRLNKEVDNIVITKSIASVATALHCEGGVPDNSENAITLQGYNYDDGDFYVYGSVLYSRVALERWKRYLMLNDNTAENGGHIVKQYSYDTTSQEILCDNAIAELTKIRDMGVNYEVDITKLPDNVKIGDRVNIVDDNGELYLSTRILKLETSKADQKITATLGEYLLKTSGISEKVAELAAEFAKNSVSVKRAAQIATNAKAQAEEAEKKADEAAEVVEEAKQAANTATQSANSAEAEAKAAQAAVDKVEESVSSMQETVTQAQNAANNAYAAADTATQKAEEAKQAAENAQGKAEEAESAAGNAQSAADTALSKADSAISHADTAKGLAEEASTIAQAAKLDAEHAEEDIAAFAKNLETVESTMKAEYARKTDLTEATADLETQIKRNAAEISSTASKVQVIDETKNDAAFKAQAAYYSYEKAQEEAQKAVKAAQKAQADADATSAAAEAAQAEANTAKAAYETAKAVSDKAVADLETAQKSLAEIEAKAEATQEEIAQAQAAVTTAQNAADIAIANAETARKIADEAQTVANDAVDLATQAQISADVAVQLSKTALSVAEIKGTAQQAQEIADEAHANATAAQNTANLAAAEAEAAQTTAENAYAVAEQAHFDLAAAEQNLADVLANVEATQEEIAQAQAAVTTAQNAAYAAEVAYNSAVNAANSAIIDAERAQAAADTAKTAANNAQAAADSAKVAVDKALHDVSALERRVTTAETSITQNAEEITLRATKTEVTETAETLSESIIQQVAEMIRMSITDGKGQSLMVQTAEGWTFSTATLQDTVNSTADNLNNLTQDVGGVKNAVDILNNTVKELDTLSEYVKIGTYTYKDENGVEQVEPSIDMGENDTGFKLKITNTRILFTDGANVLVEIESKEKSLKTEKITANAVKVGGWAWRSRNNGNNLGLVWEGV